MKKMLLLVGLFLGILTCAIAQNRDEEKRDYIEVYGTAVMEVVPDEIYVKIVLRDKEQRSKTELDQQEKKLFAVLQKAGIDVKKDLSVRSMSGNRYKLKSGPLKMKKEYILLVHDVKTLDCVFAGLEVMGGVDAEIDRVDHSQMEKFRRDIKVDAIKVAKEKAEALAAAIGQYIGAAIYIGEERWGGFAGQFSNVAMNAMRGEEPGIDFEKIALQGTIQVRFKLLAR